MMTDPKTADETETPPCVPTPYDDGITHDDGSAFDDGAGYDQ